MTGCAAVAVASDLHGAEIVEKLVASLDPILAAASVHRVPSTSYAPITEPFACLVLTGGTERAILAVHAQRNAMVEGEPLLLLAHADHNSLPAALEAAALLRLEGHRVQIVVCGIGTNARTLHDAVHNVSVWHDMRRARVGLLGTASDWLVASSPDRDAFHRVWGSTLVDLDLGSAIESVHATTSVPLATPVRIGAKHNLNAPSAPEVDSAARFDTVLQQIVERENLDAVTVRCFDLIRAAGTSGCLALSAVNDRGVIAGCEGDIASTIGLLWSRQLVGKLGWMANPAMIDRATGVVELAHCTVPLSLTTSYALHTHFESGKGVGIVGELPVGPATLLRLGGQGLAQLWCAEGEALRTHGRVERCRTQLDVRIDPSEAGELLDRPLGNHLIVIAGHHGDQLRKWWSQTMKPR